MKRYESRGRKRPTQHLCNPIDSNLFVQEHSKG